DISPPCPVEGLGERDENNRWPREAGAETAAGPHPVSLPFVQGRPSDRFDILELLIYIPDDRCTDSLPFLHLWPRTEGAVRSRERKRLFCRRIWFSPSMIAGSGELEP